MLPILEIIRLEESLDGVFGILKINKEVFCATLELPDRLNMIDVSCIPAQQYLCDKVSTAKYGDTYKILNVPGRSQILFHAGNTERDTHGCILLGEHFGKLKGVRAILNSGVTFKEFMKKVGSSQNLHLTIREVY